MMGDIQKSSGIIERVAHQPKTKRAYISIELTLLRNGDDMLNRKDLRHIERLMSIRYSNLDKDNPYGRFLISSEILSTGHRRAFGYKDFLKQCETNKELEFLKNYSDIREKTFDVAKRNAGCNIPINFDIEKYILDLKKANCIDEDIEIPLLRTLEQVHCDYAIKQYGDRARELLERLGYLKEDLGDKIVNYNKLEAMKV